MLRFLGALGCWTVGSIRATGMDLADAPRRKQAIAQAADLGRSLVKPAADKQTFPAQRPQHEALFERMAPERKGVGSEWHCRDLLEAYGQFRQGRRCCVSARF
jgi:hypothetical protein